MAAPDLVTGAVPAEADPVDGAGEPAHLEHGSGTAAATGVVLRLAASRYVLDLADIAEVVPVPVVTRIPGSPPWLLGVANWRGRILPVLDLRPLVGSPPAPLATSARVLVLARDDVMAGVVAETVAGVCDVAIGAPAVPPATLSGEAARLVLGQVRDAAGPLAVLDAGAVLGLRQRLERRRSG